MEGAEKPKRKRKRTGCLSCRARRVRCDERKPTCERCENANIDCAGYETRRQVTERPKVQGSAQKVPRKRAGRMSRRSPEIESWPLSEQNESTTAIEAHFQNTLDIVDPVHYTRILSNQSRDSRQPRTIIPVPIDVRDDGAPLTALLSNPDSSQRPCADARWVLAYHQFVFRTLPALFPSEHMGFWRDELCHEAWGCQPIYLAMTALGNMHRAALLLPMPSENDRNRGLDTKVIAFQTYTRALESLASHIHQAKARPDLLVAVLELLAYFECFAGNTPAALGHIQVAVHYYSQIGGQSSTPAKSPNAQPRIPEWNLKAIESCLQDLCHIWRTALPFFRPTVSIRQGFPSGNMDISANIVDAINHDSGMPLCAMLQRSLDKVVRDSSMDGLVWDLWAAHEHSPLIEDVLNLKEQLRRWRTRHVTHLPQQLTHSDLNTFQDFRNELKADTLPMPPLPHTDSSTSFPSHVVAALYSLYMGRTMWALAMLGPDETEAEAHETSAYFYFYEALRFVATQLGSQTQCADQYVPSEGLKPGLLAILHVIAQCCPRPAWLPVIVNMIRQIGHEGLTCGEPLAISLVFLQAFETCSGVLRSVQEYPSPAERIIMVLIPEKDGQSYVCYYARPKALISANTGQRKAREYEPVGHGRWSNSSGSDEKTKPEVKVYGEEFADERFTSDWLLESSVAREWLPWSADAEFDLCRALRNHIDGSRRSPT